jgi:hypothetical protein
MTNSSFLSKLILALSVLFLVSCDTEFNGIGADIIDSDVHNDIIHYNARLTAFDRPTGAVQANNLDVNSLGVYDSPVFGKTIAHFVTQLELESANPVLTHPAIDSVYLYVPYYSTLESTGTDGSGTYTLDSIYGNVNGKYRLSLYRNGYFLRTTDPGSADATGQKYYSNDMGLVESNKGVSLLDGNVESVEQYYSSSEIKRMADKFPDDATPLSELVERKAPGIFLNLDKTTFQQQILEAPAGSLVNSNVFKNYFRGLYFKAEQIGNESIMGVPKFGDGTITIIYRDDKLDSSGNPVLENGVVVRIAKKIILNLDGNTINFFENTPADAFTSAITSSDPVGGDERLYLKGGEGSMAFIDLNQEDLNTLKEDPVTGERVLINEANLIFYIDKTAMAAAKEPMRVYLYDVNNNRPLYDYYTDTSSNSTYPKFDKVVHSGLIEYDEDERGLRYKIRITDHINNIVNKDSTNVMLGLVVTEDINLVGNASLRTQFTENKDGQSIPVKFLPVSSVIHPFGTILYGSNALVPEDKRLKLEIFYTKPN